MSSLQHLLDRNRSWADTIKQDQPNFFANLSEQQNPDYLWIGCSDSRVPESQIADLPPGQIFVHRNIANLVVKDDENCLSVLQYAVEALDVHHIIICGHYGCGGVKAALQDNTHGYIDHWLRSLRRITKKHRDKLGELNFSRQHDLLCKLNVIRQVANVCNTNIVQQAWKNGSSLSVYGWIYSLQNGTINELQAGISSLDELNQIHQTLP